MFKPAQPISDAITYAMEHGMNREEAIAALVACLVKSGATPQMAVDAVFGPGTHSELAASVYESLRAG